jgi:DTW domain-containing protein YfiP
MSRRIHAHHRCRRCHLHHSLCLCGELPRVETRTKLVLFIHRIEDRKPSNTGRLAARCLPNSEVFVRGDESAPSEPFVAGPGTRPLLLFPGENAVSIEQFAGMTEPVTLVVPDGTWRQAFKVRNRIPGLGDLPCVSLPEGPESAYRLRTEAHRHGLSTIEAIARALGVLEGDAARDALLRVFRMMVDRTLWARGQLPASSVSGGVPPGATQHDPRSGQGHAS